MDRWRRPGRQAAFRDIELVDLGAKAGCLELLIKAGLDRIPVVAPLMMMILLLSIKLALLSYESSRHFSEGPSFILKFFENRAKLADLFVNDPPLKITLPVSPKVQRSS